MTTETDLTLSPDALGAAVLGIAPESTAGKVLAARPKANRLTARHRGKEREMKLENMTVGRFFATQGKSACDAGREWALANCATIRDVWEKCERADWMLWMLNALGNTDKSVLRLTVATFREMPFQLGKPMVAYMVAESITAVNILEKFLNGEATTDELDAASYEASYAASYAASRAARYTASYAASYTASYAASRAASRAASDAAHKWQANKLRELVFAEWEGGAK